MKNYKRNAFDKLYTLLFGKDLRITEGEPYSQVRKGDFSSYYPKSNYISKQEIPSENVFDIRDYGAVPNDKSVDNAEFINSAIKEASVAKGTVLIDGGDYTSTTAFLQSNVTFFIAENSSLIANETGKGYKNKALLWGENCENITLTGGGSLNGNGNFFGRKPFFDENMLEDKDYIDVIEMRRDYRAQIRFAHPNKFGSPCRLSGCKNIVVENFVFENSADWTFRLHKCENVKIHNTVINNNRNVANADGFDMVQTSNVEISHCFISTSDDGIVIKNAIWEGCNGEMKNINISDCEIISRTNSIKIGTETTHDIHSVNVENCKLFMTDVYPGSVSGISIEACDGSKVYDFKANNIEMNRCTCPIFIRLGNRNRAKEVNEQSARAVEYGQKAVGKALDKKTFDMKSEVYNIEISNIKATGVELPIIIAGYKQKSITKRVKNVTLKNIDLEYANKREVVDKRMFIPEYVEVYPECWRFRNLPAYKIWARHAENITVENVTCKAAPNTWKKETEYIDVI